MEKSIIAEGKTTAEAIEKGLKELKVSKDSVDVKVIESQEKRSFFSILEPRVVKVELTLKENIKKVENHDKKDKKIVELNEKDIEIATKNLNEFLDDFVKNSEEDIEYTINATDTAIEVNLNNENIGYLIGYRGETLYAFQNILTAVASKGIERRIRVLLDVENYKAKRIKTLEDLAEKMAKRVLKSRKSITLEPMKPYERKIIHSKLQEYENIDTTSIGEEPRRKIVISYNK